MAYSAGIYRFLWRHASLVELEHLVFADATSAVSTFVTGAVLISGLGLSAMRLAFSALMLDGLLAAALLAIPRIAVRIAARNPTVVRRAQHRAIIVGARNLGQSILHDLSQSSSHSSNIVPVAFVDDDPYKHGQTLGGLTVVGAVSKLDEAIDNWQATAVIIAVSEAKGAFVRKVVEAGALGKSGELFALDMGEPVRIMDLAHDLIRLSGFEEGVDVDITYSGVRPGEKLYEQVFFGHEAVEPTAHPKVRRIQLRALEPDFHAPPPVGSSVHAAAISDKQRRRRVAWHSGQQSVPVLNYINDGLRAVRGPH